MLLGRIWFASRVGCAKGQIDEKKLRSWKLPLESRMQILNA